MDGITERVKKTMNDKGLSPTQMADRIGVQRSAISHLLSGRNKPSLDFILKVLEAFPDVSSDWLLKGLVTSVEPSTMPSFPKSENAGQKTIQKVLVLYSDRTVEEFLAK